MKTAYFVFPRMNISLFAPGKVLEKASLFYPNNIRNKKPPFITYAYSVRREGEKRILRKDSQVLDTVQSDLQAVFRLEFDIETTILRHRGNRLAFHAGCVRIGDQACLIAGNPDSGKTTTTFHLVEMGHSFMCEEIAFLDAETGEIHPYLQTLALESQFIEKVKLYFPIKQGEVFPLNYTLMRYSPRRIQKDPLRLSTILVPERKPNAEPDIFSLKPGIFLTEFLSYCFEPNVDMENFLDCVIDLLEKCRLYRLRYKDISDCRSLLRRLPPPAST